MVLTFKLLFLIIPLLLCVAFIILLERKILGFVGFRLGPNKVSFLGFLQPITDALKLSNKMENILSNYSFFFYYFSFLFVFFSSIYIWFCIFFEPLIFSAKFSVVIFMLILGFNSLNSIVCGLSTFSKFSLIGGLRTVSQLVSYEAVLYLCIFFLLYMYSSFSFFSFQFHISFFFALIVPYCFYIWLPSFLADLNRTPYDFSEGESELVSGFNTEFGSKGFTFIFLAEYANILFFCLVTSFMFFWMNLYFFFFFFLIFVIWIRGVLPRFRFDKLMGLAWKFFIPFLTSIFCLYLMEFF